MVRILSRQDRGSQAMVSQADMDMVAYTTGAILHSG